MNIKLISFSSLALWAITSGAWATELAGSPASADSIDFNRQIRPILASKCFTCHGPDDKTRKSGLRLDLRESAVAPAKSGAMAIVPGKPEKSELIRRITTHDEDDVMPPGKAGAPLTEAQTAAFKKWIEQGAAYTTHWAYVKPVRPALPVVKDGGKDAKWAKNDIDRFILAKLERENLKPNAEADRYALIRRLSIDLTGLPPTIAEADAFVNDKSADAYEKLVDSLLARPTYGERWASVWLDLARYADSQGYAPDEDRVIWRYRDWVIQSLNENLPFDQFTIQQIAGDLLPSPTPSQLIATAFNRNTLTNTEGGTNREEFRTAAVMDRVNTTTQVWLASTFGCAQCHNHKYDPFSQKEYYQLYAIFNSTEDADRKNEAPTIEVPRAGLEKGADGLRGQVAVIRAKLAEETKTADEQRAAWEKTVIAQAGGKDIAPQRRGDAEKKEGELKKSDVKKDELKNQDVKKNSESASSSASPRLGGESTLPKTDGVPKEIMALIQKPAKSRAKKEQDQLSAYYHGLFPELKKLDEQAKALNAQFGALTTTVPIMKEGTARESHILLRGDFLNIGDKVEPGLPAALVSASPNAAGLAIGGNAGAGAAASPINRLTLAKWIASAENPLTARVAANRLWEELLGVGIVETSEEFGMQGDLPSHPELLDYLATEYVRVGWDTKAMIRLIVTSAAYRQSSAVSDEARRIDPFNRLISRGPRVRLAAETVRDQALFAAGLLSAKMYGPPCQPPKPNFGLSAAFGPTTDWKADTDENRWRRGVYVRIRRNAPYPSMTTFDAPERTACTLRRIRTNTPLQALVTLNDPCYVEAAQGLARRVIKEGGAGVAARMTYAFRTVLTRPPSEVEIGRLTALYEKTRAAYAADSVNATAMATKPLGALPAGMEAVDAAAWTVVANVLLNLDETLAKR